jgi:hypothetical protein
MNRGKQNHKWTYRNENQINKPSRQLFLPHKLFTEHPVNVIENPPQKYNKNKKNLNLWSNVSRLIPTSTYNNP